jgi:hypothetical protein
MSALDFTQQDRIGGLQYVRVSEDSERAARQSLRAQIAKLERELADTFVTAFSMGSLEHLPTVPGEPRLLGLGDLERVRDELAERLHTSRVRLTDRADIFEANRIALEEMLLDPGSHRYRRIALSDLGQSGCGAYEVRPRLGLIGMLAGWWHVKISSGCPLPRGRDARCGPPHRGLCAI